MTNKEAIENLKGCVVSYELDEHARPNGNVTADLTMEVINLAIAALEQQEKDRWISVKDRLPEKDCSCRVTEGDFKSVFDCHWSNRKKQFEVWSYYYDVYVPIINVTAWKLIEAPYMEEEA